MRLILSYHSVLYHHECFLYSVSPNANSVDSDSFRLILFDELIFMKVFGNAYHLYVKDYIFHVQNRKRIECFSKCYSSFRAVLASEASGEQ